MTSSARASSSIITAPTLVLYALLVHLGRDTARFPPPCAVVSEAIGEMLETKEPSRRDALVDGPARAGGAMTNASLPAMAQRANTNVHTKDCMTLE